MATYCSKLDRVGNKNIIQNIVRSGLTSADISASIVGKTFYVDSTIGSAGNDGLSWETPLATITQGLAKCTASKGDAVIVSPLHTETVTAAITMSKIGVALIGVCSGKQMPIITGNGAIDAIDITAAGCSVSNIRFAAPATDAQTADINIAAARCTVSNTVHIGSTTGNNKVAIITVTAAGHDAVIDGIQVHNSVVEVVGGIVIEGVAERVEIKNCFFYCDTYGFTNGALHVSAVALAVNVHDNVFANAKAATAVVNFAANATGICYNNFCSGRHTTIASNIVTGTSTDWFETYVTEEAVKNGLLMPAVDAD
jgi:hypothetical protein